VPFEQIGQSAVKRLWRQKSELKAWRERVSPRAERMLKVTTALISDLHLGAASGRDLLRRGDVRAVLLEALDGVDELVLLGDVVELREAPLRDVIAAARPALADIATAMAGGRITLTAGNHDHQLAAPLIDRARLARRPLEPQTLAEPPRDDSPLGLVSRALAGPDLRVAYPGVWVRHDVFATHGHYLDVHNTVPSFERLANAAIQRVTGRVPEPRATVDDYEAALAPVYSLLFALAQTSRNGRPAVRSDTSARLRATLTRHPRPLAARFGVPAAVRALNAAGLGPLKADLSAVELRRAALRGMRTAVERLGVDARHVVFGHTHRSGPHARDEGWGTLVNSGSWILEPAFLGARPDASPYFPGHAVFVHDEGPPELRRLLHDLPSRGT